MATESEEYLAVLKASYDYDPQSEDEIALRENQLLFLLQEVDEDWWKVKIKGDSQEEDTAVGLVPAAYVEPAIHKSVVKAIYEYTAGAPGELSVKEDEVLLVFEEEEDWLLVQSQTEGGKAGFVPGNYVELASLDGDAQDTSEVSASQIVVPPSPPPVVSNYQDPADRVASTSNKAKADDIKTWSVTEIDKKGKKKKGTLGVGNGAVFFASESDKTPVRKWQTSDIDQSGIEKSKHIHVSFGGSEPISLHFNAGSKDTAEAILDKLQSSRALSETASSVSPRDSARAPAGRLDGADHEKARRSGASVHFSDASPDIIPNRDSAEYGDYGTPEAKADEDVQEGEDVVALYDFNADGDDELSVREGEHLLVIERDGDEWWKCRNSDGAEGVVPASYLELSSAPTQEPEVAANDDDRETEEIQQRAAAAAEVEREAAQRTERERAVKERAAAKERAEKERAERKRTEQERVEKERVEKDQADKERSKAEAQRRPQAATSSQRRPEVNKSTPSSASVSKQSNGESSSTNRTSPEGNRPHSGKTRIWHDRSGQFRVEAAFLGFSNGKIRLHKINGVVVEVPTEKMSVEDMRYVEKITRKKSSNMPRSHDDDDEPLSERRKSLQTTDSQRRSSPAGAPTKKAPKIDWFEFFLAAGCDVDDCTRYASSFEKDKIDENILPDITDATMRSLGLREGDIIRVTKAIQKKSQNQTNHATRNQQMLLDEELARQLQEEENALGHTNRNHEGTSPAPNLFTGPGGTLKNNTIRRGRPQPSKTLPPSTVDLNAITTASDHIQRTVSPQVAGQSASNTATVASSSSQARSNSAQKSTSLIPASGFDDDAWANRPSSAKPSVATPASTSTTTRAPSAPPMTTSAQKASPESQAVSPARESQKSASGLAGTTEADIFDKLSRLKTSKPSPAPSPASVPPIMNTPITNFQPAPAAVPAQSIINPIPQLIQPPIGPRGPFAPVPANQGLLQPLIPTNNAFNTFVPTRVGNAPSPFQNQPSPPAFLAPAVTGFPTQPVLSQPTGMALGGFGPGITFLGNGFGGIQSQPTGFNPALGPSALNGGMSPPPPLPSLPTSITDSTSPANVFAQMKAGGPMSSIPSPPPSNTSPANVFAQMKSGTFATGNDASNPQPADKYDALRPTPVALQPTGWAYQGTNYQTGFSGY